MTMVYPDNAEDARAISRLPLSRLALLGFLMLMPLRASAQIYECLDAEGRREFAQKCSPGTVSKREVSKAGGPEAPAASPLDYKQKEAEFQQRRMQREDKESKEQAAAAEAARKCKTQQYRVTELESVRRMPNGKDPQTGEVRYLNQEERATELKKAQEAAATFCK